jgi:hypothetical protein
MNFLATTGGIYGDDVRVTAVEHRFGRVTRLPATFEWLDDNGSCYRWLSHSPPDANLLTRFGNFQRETFLSSILRKVQIRLWIFVRISRHTDGDKNGNRRFPGAYGPCSLHGRGILRRVPH